MRACLFFFLVASALRAQEPVDMVYPWLDAANSRWFFFNTASRPFGMVNLSPDNAINADWGAGYRYKKDSIKCFSHVHGWQLSGIPVMVQSGRFTGHHGADVYGSRFNHEHEVVKAGYHRVFLDSYNIAAELTSTKRVGFHKYTFGEESNYLLFDFSTWLGPADTDSAFVEQISEREIAGYALMGATRRRPKPMKVFFVAQSNLNMGPMKTWEKGILKGIEKQIHGSKNGAYFEFKGVKELLLKVAISYTSMEEARKNLENELAHWDFDRVVEESRQEWNGYLKRIEIKGGTRDEQARFYTDLFHALQGRRVISDASGTYPDYTGEDFRVGQIPLPENGKPKFNHYNSDSFWGAQWTINTLWHLVYPEITEEFVNSLLQYYKDGGLIPRGPAGGNYTYVMTGASSTPFIVSAWLKGIKGFNGELAWEGMLKNHSAKGMMAKAGYEHNTFSGGGAEEYLNMAYVPYPLQTRQYGFHQRGATQTLEYAYQDYALSQFAIDLGKTKESENLLRRSKNYQNLYNKEIGWMWPKTREGEWFKPVDILSTDHWVEGNGAQYTWFVPHDVAGLAELMGGKDSLANRLNSSFKMAEKHDFTSGKAHADEGKEENKRVYINYGNQPSIQTAFLFHHVGKPELSDYWSKKIINKVYSGLSPFYGYSGDEDQGLMGSLAVLLKMGLFSVDGGVDLQPSYELVSPFFDEVVIHLNPDYYAGREIRLQKKPKSKNKLSMRWNGKKVEDCMLLHEDLVKGGKLVVKK